MGTLIVSGDEIRRFLSLTDCIEAVDTAFRALAEGKAVNPLRSSLRLEGGRRILGMMPGAVEDPPVLGAKIITVFPGNHGTELDAHQGVVLLFDPERGPPLAILEASTLTAIRTAAASAVATRALAREDAQILAIIGSGVQARSHFEAMLAVRPIEEVRVFSPTEAHRGEFARRESERTGVRVEAVSSARAAVEGAEIICTVTSSSVPVLEGAWLSPGAHLNSVGASVPSARELDDETVARARLFVDSRESALHEAGDLLMPMEAGLVGADHIQGEIGEVLTGKVPGRCSAEEITWFESLGLAVEDLLPARLVFERARAANAGTEVELTGYRDETA